MSFQTHCQLALVTFKGSRLVTIGGKLCAYSSTFLRVFSRLPWSSCKYIQCIREKWRRREGPALENPRRNGVMKLSLECNQEFKEENFVISIDRLGGGDGGVRPEMGEQKRNWDKGNEDSCSLKIRTFRGGCVRFVEPLKYWSGEEMRNIGRCEPRHMPEWRSAGSVLTTTPSKKK